MLLEFYFDLASPYAYLGLARLPSLVLAQSCDIDYRPVDVEALKRAAGNIGPAMHELASRKRYVMQDAARWAKRYGIALAEPAGWNATRLNRGTFMAIDRGMAARYLDVAARHVWGAGGNPSNEDLIGSVATQLGWSARELLEYTVSSQAAQRERDTLAAARAAGVFGVPTTVLGAQLWWGNDRLELVQGALRHG